MRLFAAGLALEANTFSPLPTSLAAFKEKLYDPPGTHPPGSAPVNVRGAGGRRRTATP
jgi:microcystin degradation protein MlrC